MAVFDLTMHEWAWVMVAVVFGFLVTTVVLFLIDWTLRRFGGNGLF